MEAPPHPLSSRPKRTRISYHAELTMTTDAALRRERRTNFINATELNRKFGGAKWRDLCVDALSWKCFSTGEVVGCGPPKGMKNGLGTATALLGSVTLPFAISTEVERSLCGCFLLEVFFDRVVMGPPKVMKSALSRATTLQGSATLPFVIPSIPNKFVISTGAYPDFLPRCIGQGGVCALP
jgi:hypothetical protein